ncbi:hypothetical protein COB55_04905 [Candidatus Wolfebacteria bacterium]|nr:MAG: hypothetical protein COB55_04905 [Candidatus Wolfebacteria bacterium]
MRPEEEDKILRQVRRMKGPIPDKIANKPHLGIGLYFYYDSFFELGTDRTVNNSIGQIPYSSILMYCKYYKFDYEETSDFLYLIRKIDSAYIEYMSKKNELSRASKKTTKKS